jgi:hypothetical protein
MNRVAPLAERAGLRQRDRPGMAQDGRSDIAAPQNVEL